MCVILQPNHFLAFPLDLLLSTLAFVGLQLDALHPAVSAFRTSMGDRTDHQAGIDALSEAVKVCPTSLNLKRWDVLTCTDVFQAAVTGAAATVNMNARAGRASYVHPSQLVQPDPGARAVAIWLKAIYSAFE